MLSGNLRKDFRWETGREGVGGVSFRMTNSLRPGDRLQSLSSRITQTHDSPPAENTTCASFEEYEEVPETVPLDFTVDGVMWVTSKIYGAAGVLGAEDVDIRNCLIHFGCASE